MYMLSNDYCAASVHALKIKFQIILFQTYIIKRYNYIKFALRFRAITKFRSFLITVSTIGKTYRRT